MEGTTSDTDNDGDSSFNDLNLNIVAFPSSTAPTTTKTDVKKKPKKRNKYERRRRKAQIAKQGKIGSLAGEGGQTTAPEDPTTASNDKTSIASEPQHGPSHAASDRSRTNHPKQNVDSTAQALSEMIDDSSETANDDAETKASADQVETSKQPHHNNTLPEDEEERAKYLAEFHARPLELDRRAGHVVSKVRSRDSTHLFAETAEWSDMLGLLHARLVTALQSPRFGLTKPTVVQTKAIPAFFQGDQRHNLLLQSETGSGKTLSYLLPILQSLAVDRLSGELRRVDRVEGGTQCIILCPTRELAMQVFAVTERLCSSSFNWLVPGCFVGEERRKSEKARIRKGLVLIVATPGRLLDHLDRTETLLAAIKGNLDWLVLDEADRLLDMGLGEQVKQIVQRVRKANEESRTGGSTWRSVLVSATVTPSVENLAKDSFLSGSDDSAWVWIKGAAGDDDHAKSLNDDEDEYAESTPRQLTQLHMTVSAKLRLAALVAFLVQRIEKGERTVVFMSTCDSVDYHHALFGAMESILKEEDTDTANGIFGNRCPIFRLHGNVPHSERHVVLKRFMKQSPDDTKRSSVLLATDVAARGLNLHNVDWTVQYDPPSEVSDYIHRAGRVARAGKAGHSLLFLLPSERQFLDVLKKRGVRSMSAYSLSSTLNDAARFCAIVTTGERSKGKGSRSGENFASELLRRMEDCVAQDGARNRSSFRREGRSDRANGSGDRQKDTAPDLGELARAAFLSHIRAYPTKEKSVKHIFMAKALHFGHIARSFALKEPPKKVATRTKGSNKREASKVASTSRTTKNDKKRRAVGPSSAQHQAPKMNKRSLLFDNASKLQANGLDCL